MYFVFYHWVYEVYLYEINILLLFLGIEELNEQNLTLAEFNTHFKSPYDWRIIIVQGKGTAVKETRGFYMGM